MFSHFTVNRRKTINVTIPILMNKFYVTSKIYVLCDAKEVNYYNNHLNPRNKMINE